MMFEDDSIFIRKEDGIFVCGFKEDVIVDRTISSRLIKKRIELSKGKNQSVLGDFRGVKYWTMSSRNNDMKEKGYEYIKRTAVVMPNPSIKIIWAFVSKIFPPPVPLKSFTNYETAKKWLLNEREKDRQKE